MLTTDREFEFGQREFEAVRKLIYEHAGIALSDAKMDMVYSRLARRLRATGLKSFRDYLAFLDSGHAGEWESFVNALTTNLTDFFRESHHFTLLSEFLAARRGRPLRLWSAAASTGEEPCSMAMTVLETLGPAAPVRILASDLDTSVLGKAREGIYPLERLDKLTPERRHRFFQKGVGNREGHARVKPELRAMIDYFQLNLLSPRWPIEPPLDAIFCRNVMIYFDKPTQRGILTRMKPLLKADGLLFVGHSESLYHATDLFRPRGKTVYEHAEAADTGRRS